MEVTVVCPSDKRPLFLLRLDKSTLNFQFCFKQAGTGPSRRHIQGSKIAKRLPSVKYSFTVVENRKITY